MVSKVIFHDKAPTFENISLAPKLGDSHTVKDDQDWAH